ncbi:MAG: hypothetical protein AAGM22_24885 [Acidobacteriota bacterium]
MSSPAGCFKYGCIGCLSITALGFGLILFLSTLQFFASTDPEPVERLAEQVLPTPPTSPEPPTIDPDQPDAVEFAPVPELSPDQGVGTLILDMAMGDFTIQPGPPDQPVRIEADFDASKFELKEDWTQGLNGNWTYKVSFDAKGGFFGLLFGGGGNVNNNITVTVPRGHPMRIAGSIKMGESKTDLGGLWLESFNVDYGMGDHFVEIREPLVAPMDDFTVVGSMGELEIRNLGNGSPREVDVEQGMGELFLDLKGPWRNDAEIKAQFSMGGCRVWVPEDVRIDVTGGAVSMGESRINLPDVAELPDDAPRLDLVLGGSMGEVTVEY